MTTIPNGHEEKCTQCGSKAVNVKWDERVDATQVQYLWRCSNCKNEFITQVASDQKPISDAEMIFYKSGDRVKSFDLLCEQDYVVPPCRRFIGGANFSLLQVSMMSTHAFTLK